MSGDTELVDITAEIERVSFSSEDTGWAVVRARDLSNQRVFTAVGHLGPIRAGETLKLGGQWTQHKTYGPQFKIARFHITKPTDAAGIIRYLATGVVPGIGPKTAERIVAKFGDATLRILDSNPHRLSEVPGIGRKKCENIAAAWQQGRAIHDIMIFLNNHGVSPLFATRIYKLYGRDSIKVVTEDPYRLAVDVHGIGFLSADKIAQEVGIAADSVERVRAAIMYLLQQGEDFGHCYLTTQQIHNELIKTLGLGSEILEPKIAASLENLEANGAVFSEPLDDDIAVGKAHYRSDLAVAEANVSTLVSALLRNSMTIDHERIETWLRRYQETNETALSEDQWHAVKHAVSNRAFVLTGGPGVGKTTTANIIIRLLKAMGRSVALCAPTGRAAQRLSEVSGMEAKTIHRLLEWQAQERSFARDENNPLPVQVVLCDESSMLDIRLAESLLRSIPETAQIIFIGDVDQLPSVGPGNFLRDLIQSGEVPYQRLTTIFRQAATSKIVQIAHQINHGDMPEISDDEQADCWMIRKDQPDEILDQICKLVCRDLPNKGYNPVKDVQILTPMNRGPLGTQAINKRLQELLNPLRQGEEEVKRGFANLRPRDKVIQSSNNYELNVFNGDIGFVEHTKVDGDNMVIRFGDRLVTFDSDAALDLKLAYAITIHKSQGSEFPVVILPTSMQHYIMLQRNLIYTGLTRAKRLAVFVGSPKALKYAIQNQRSRARQTKLIPRLQAEVRSL